MAKALSDSGDFRVQGLLVVVPAVAIPDLEVIEVPDDHDLLLDPGVLEQGLVEGDPAGRVELGVERAPREVAGQLAALGADGGQGGGVALGSSFEGVGCPHRDAGLQRLGQHHS